MRALKFFKSGLMSESPEGMSNLPEFVPKTILFLFNAVHSVDKMGKSQLFVFTSLIDLHDIQMYFRNVMNNLIR